MKDPKNVLDVVTKALPITYVIGFLIINGYLSNFGFSDFNILNATYLKAGVLFIILYALIFMAVYFAHGNEKPTGDLKKSWPVLVISIYNLSILCIIIAIQFINLADLIITKRYLFMIFAISIFLHFLIRLWAMGVVAKNDKGVMILTILPFIFLLPVLIILAINYTVVIMLIIFVFILGETTWVSLGLYGDKSYNERLFTDILILIFACFLFGKNIYPQIPYKFGGGQPYEIIYNPQIDSLSNKVQLKQDTLKVLYENNERLLMKNKKGEIIFKLKSELKTYLIIQK